MVSFRAIAQEIVEAVREKRKERRWRKEEKRKDSQPKSSPELTAQVSDFLGKPVKTWRPDPVVDRPLNMIKALRDCDQQVTESELRILAASEGVRLNPPASRNDRFHGDDYHLRDGLLARLGGPDNGFYFFLTDDGGLIKCENSLGKGSLKGVTEAEVSTYRKIARRYWNGR
ncbi:hypothetical protein GGR57DRAFT_509385 [Xylariaceae sp. FL1272]|nr:hypothetical protein GGR57DRAFT_509385 [Xylariaceae sp. FL1272]